MNNLHKMSLIKNMVIGTLVISLAGCVQSVETPKTDVPNGGTNTKVEAPLEVTQLTAETITDEELAAFTGFEAEYQNYLNNNATKVHFLTEENSEIRLEGSISIYSGTDEDSTSLYLFESEGTVIDAKLDEFSGSVSSEIMDADYLYYSFSNMMEKQPTEVDMNFKKENAEAFELELQTAFVGQPLYKLHEKLGVYVPVHRYEKVDENIKLNTYMLVSEVGYTASTDINVVYDNEGTISKIYLDDSYGPGKLDPLKILRDQLK